MIVAIVWVLIFPATDRALGFESRPCRFDYGDRDRPCCVGDKILSGEGCFQLKLSFKRQIFQFFFFQCFESCLCRFERRYLGEAEPLPSPVTSSLAMASPGFAFFNQHITRLLVP
jgi:hypothetical protein